MLAARLRARKPTRYRDIAAVLVEIGALSKNNASTLGEMISLRNVLVHRYTELSPSRIYKAAQRIRRDTNIIITAIGSFLETESIDPRK